MTVSEGMSEAAVLSEGGGGGGMWLRSRTPIREPSAQGPPILCIFIFPGGWNHLSPDRKELPRYADDSIDFIRGASGSNLAVLAVTDAQRRLSSNIEQRTRADFRWHQP